MLLCGRRHVTTDERNHIAMKKIIAVLLALCLLCGAIALAAAEAKEELFYASDFAKRADEWHARGKNTVLTQTEAGLAVSGRSGKNDGPGIDLQLKAGLHYNFTIELMQDEKSTVDMSVTIAHKKAGVSSFTPLGTAKAKQGEWVTVSGEWTAEAFDSYELYVSATGKGAVDFTVGSLRILVSDPNHITPVAYEGELPSLKALAGDRFDFGTCMSRADVTNARRAALVAYHYNIVTPENELKPDSVLDLTASRRLAQTDDTAVAVHFSNALPILNFARDNGLKLHGHVLVWHSQSPEEFFHVGYDRSKPFVTREVMLVRLENYIRQVFEWTEAHYPGLIVSWDVANECVADGSSSLRQSNWTKVVGADFVARAFEYADKYAPEDVLLYYNDYSTPYEPKLTGIVKLLTSLVEEGHIDGFGFQSHYGSSEPSVAAVENAFRKITALGLRLRVSELDLTVTADNDNTRAVQASQYSNLMNLYIRYADVMEAVQVWGVCDGTSWIREKYPLMFDANLQPKPAFFSVAEALQAAE